LGARRKQETNQRRTTTMSNPRPNYKPLLLENNHNENQNFHVSFVVMITTLETAHIVMKWPNFSKEIHNPLYSLNLFRSNNLWLHKPPRRGAVPTNPMMRP
jgi:hypothetical protein